MITHKVQSLIDQVNANSAQIGTLQSMSQPLRLRLINRMKYDMAQEAKVLIPQKLNTEQLDRHMDYTNLNNARKALDYIIRYRTKIIDTYEIRDVHKTLSEHTDNTRGGIYRIEDTVAMRQQSPSYAKVLYKMDDIKYILSPEYALDTPKLIRAFDVHAEMIFTQPFQDFNKRTARIIMNWYLMQNNYSPIIFTNPADNRNYFTALHNYNDGNLEQYYSYMLNVMLRNQQSLLNFLGHVK